MLKSERVSKRVRGGKCVGGLCVCKRKRKKKSISLEVVLLILRLLYQEKGRVKERKTRGDDKLRMEEGGGGWREGAQIKEKSSADGAVGSGSCDCIAGRREERRGGEEAPGEGGDGGEQGGGDK